MDEAESIQQSRSRCFITRDAGTDALHELRSAHVVSGPYTRKNDSD